MQTPQCSASWFKLKVTNIIIHLHFLITDIYELSISSHYYKLGFRLCQLLSIVSINQIKENVGLYLLT